MDFNYESIGTNTYLVYDVKEDDVVDSMSVGMLMNNKIPNIAPTIFTQIDDKKFLKYNISAKIPVSQYFSNNVNKHRLVGVFSGIINALLYAEDYMIDINSVLLDLDYIFVDVSTSDPLLVCLPVNTGTQQVDVGSFFKNIMFTTQFDQSENCDYVAKIMNYLNSNPILSLADFKTFLNSIDSQGSVAISGNNAASVQQPKTVQQPVVQQVPVQQPKTVQQPVVQPEAQQPKPVIFSQNGAAAQPPKQNTEPNTIPQMTLPAQTQVAGGNTDEKKISVFDLLMHYNKENVEAYKAQKGNKKAKQKNKNDSVPAVPQASFAIPGAPVANAGFAIPGQAAQPSAKPAPVTPIPQTTVGAPAKQNVAVPVAAPAAAPVATPIAVPTSAPAMPQGKPMNFGETTVLGGGGAGETTVLNAASQASQAVTPHLIRVKNNERIPLNKPVFRIGKERSYVDYFVGDNSAISRSHANIISEGGKYFIVDTNSTNHTYVDGQMIQSNNNVEITHGTKIRLANEEFEFKLY